VIRVPNGCLNDLSGTYVHALNPSFNYLAADDGGTLFMVLERTHGDAGISKPDSNPISVSLSRTANGFVGQARAMVYVAGGRSCSVDFPTELVKCEPGGLLLKSAVGGAVNDESCQPSQARDHSVMAEHRLIRTSTPVPASSLDAGLDSCE